MKYVVVTGGVMSGLGKGIVSASVGKILKSYGLTVRMLKMDGYLNVDPGTLNPYEHGEVFVLNDGTETDLDLGHYERFLNLNLDRDSSVTNGKIYKEVIDNERKGIYLGKTVQIIPHVTNVIIEHIKQINESDVVIIEVGGTVGDMENMVFLEALRQISIKEKVVFVHLSYVPLSSGNEQKTKPTQHSIRNLLQLGIYPDIIIGRCGTDLQQETKNKISLFGGVEKSCVISDPDAEIYELPLLFDRQNLGNIVMNKLDFEINQEAEKNKFKELDLWKNLVENLKNKSKSVSIGVVGKYAHLEDAYLSIKEAVKHSQMNLNIPVNFEIVEAESENLEEKLKKFDGIIVPGGFGIRGIEGKIRAVNFCRINKIPFLGLCLGFQVAVIEFARNVCNMDDANSSEAAQECPNPVIDLLFEQIKISDLGGTMRVGAYPCVIKSDTLAHEIYNKDTIDRRYRHRYGLNLKYKEILERNGMLFSGTSPDGKLMEILELNKEVHPFFIASQYHPEFSSRPEKPEELFMGLVKACAEKIKRL
ncbi:MAG: CTP synthase [Candidatus Altiarchaeales archaeon HGW-Altiarchaeales-1]|nr:MAG: CTP synthase [Candidatus Altiarchaeales archaeon HGW-Altiarchaeales-1]